MLIDDILEQAGFVLNSTYRETRFLTAPTDTCVSYDVTYEVSGGDYGPLTRRWDVTLNLYEYKPDPERVEALEKALSDNVGYLVDGWSRTRRVWLDEGQLYASTYKFKFITKE